MPKALVFAAAIFMVLASSASVLAQDWPMLGNNPARTAYTSSRTPVAPNLLWLNLRGHVLSSSPAIVDGTIYVGGSQTPYVFAVRANDGKTLWIKSTYSGEYTGNYSDISNVMSVFSSPVVLGGRVYIGAGESLKVPNGFVYSFNAENGDLEWVFDAGAEIGSSPVVVDNVLYIGSGDDHVYAINADNGELIWKTYIEDPGISSPAVMNGVVFIGSIDHYVYALNAENGEILWRFETGSGINSSPAVADNILYIGSYDKFFYAIDTKNGGLVWKHQLVEHIEPSPGVAYGKVFIASSKGDLHAFDKKTGEVIWEIDLAPNQIELLDMPISVVADGKVFLTSFWGAGYLFCIDAENGELLWKYRTSGVGGSPAIADNMIFVAGGEGLHAFGTPPPTFNQLDEEVSGVVQLSGVARGDNVGTVELNWGGGWVEAELEHTEERTGVDIEVPQGVPEWALDSLNYFADWTYRWDTTQVPDNTYTLRVRIRYTNGAYSDETTLILHVNNAARELERLIIIVGAGALVAALGALFYLLRMRR